MVDVVITAAASEVELATDRPPDIEMVFPDKTMSGVPVTEVPFR